MSEEVKELLLNVFFIIFPLFLYQMFWIDKGKTSTKSSQIVGTLCILSSILLCMSFPITFSTGFNFDLRQIPLILGSLYGGYRLDIWLYLGILAYRYLLYDTRTNSSIRNALLLHKRKGNRIRYDGCV